MPDRASVVQSVQIGVPGTAGGTANTFTALQSISIEPGIQTNRTPFRPIGHRYAGLVPPGKEWTQGAARGPATYGELIYPLSGIFGTAGTSTMGTVAGTAYQYVWTPNNSNLIVPRDFTIEQGDNNTTRSHRMTYAYWSEFGMTFNRDMVDHSGQVMAQRLQDGGTMTTGTAVTTVELIPVLPENVDVYINTSAASLGATQLDRVLSAEWRNTGFHGPIWTLDSRNSSWAAPVNLAPNTELRVMLEADSTGMAYLVNARLGQRLFLRLRAQGGTAGTVNYLFNLDFSGEIQAIAPFRDEQGVYAIEYTFACVYDGTWGKAQEITVVNKTSGL